MTLGDLGESTLVGIVRGRGSIRREPAQQDKAPQDAPGSQAAHGRDENNVPCGTRASTALVNGFLVNQQSVIPVGFPLQRQVLATAAAASISIRKIGSASCRPRPKSCRTTIANPLQSHDLS